MEKQDEIGSLLPTFFYNYMAGMVIDEPPVSGDDLFQLIGDFIMNGSKQTKEQSQAVCEKIQKTLVDKKLIKIINKYTMTAERLEKAITLNECNVTGQDQNGYADAYLGIEKFEGFTDESVQNNNEKLKRRKEKDQIQKENDYKKHLVELQKSKHKAPPTRVIHNRDKAANKDIAIDSLTLIVGGRNLLEDSRLHLPFGKKMGLVGRNGIGKTCLLTAVVRGDFGKLKKGVQMLLVEQEILGEQKTVLQTVLETDEEREQLLEKEKNFDKDGATAEQISAVYQRMQEIEVFNAEQKAKDILFGLGFTEDMILYNTCDLSGGWRMRVSLARALFVDPDILMLDEPTNHLDLDAVMWLEDYLQKTKNTIVVVSHAREFLNTVCTDIIHFFDSKLNYYKGDYDSFEKTRNDLLQNQKKQNESKELKMAHMQNFIDKFRYNSKRASLVQSRIKALDKLGPVDDILEDPTCVFMFPNPEKLSPPLLKMEEGDFHYSEDKPIFKGINFGVDMDSRIAIVGANGVGKSTLLNILSEKLQLTSGQYYKNGRLRISMFTQHHLDQLNLAYSPLEQLANTYPGFPAEKYRGHLGNFGVTGNLQIKPQYLMSGGQKSRVAFALNVWNNPHILIMDEPTNHLDLDAVNALIIALNNFQGGVLIVSHDQHLIASVCDQIWYLKNKRMKKFNGDFEVYRTALQKGKL